ncbi:MAG TPA: sulfurtransferase TusA family protein [Clostridia bacterium]|nr:sulfurtransferase TusA family protein [Clostridia bacterium]
MKQLDARGYACPMPVVMAQRALKSEEGGIEILVDNHAAVENLTRFGAANGYSVKDAPEGSDFRLTLQKK